jgi:hypothetical protein
MAQREVGEGGGPFADGLVELVQDRRAQLLVGASEEPGRLAVAEKGTEQLPGQADQPVLVEGALGPGGHQHADERLIVGSRSVGPQQCVARIADCTAPAAEDVGDADALAHLQRPRDAGALAAAL